MSTVDRSRIVADRYRLVEQLGQGGMGRVWLAHDDLLHRDVAIKEIVPPSGLTPIERQEMRERTLREARAIARLTHPNVVRIFDVLSRDGDPWIVMEYVRGRSLQERLATDGPLPVNRVVDIGLGVLAALRAAHRAGVLHRDVKPGNVLLGDDGRVVLTDFGLATVPGDPVVTRTGLVLGSPAYLAPERARDGSAGPEADMWSLGATLFAAVEGQSPYARPSAIATLAALATEPPAPAKQAGPLRPLLNGLLRKDPSERISPVEAERLLLRAAGRRSRRQLGGAPYPGVRLRRPPGPDTFAAADAALAAGPRKRPVPPSEAGPESKAAQPSKASQESKAAPAGRSAGPARSGAAAAAPVDDQAAGNAADATRAEDPRAAAPAPAVQAAVAGNPDVRPADAAAGDTETGRETPDAEPAQAQTLGGESAQAATVGGESAQTVDRESAQRRAPGGKTTAAEGSGDSARESPVPSSIDDGPQALVPIVPGPRVPAQPALGVAAVPQPPSGRPRTRRRIWWWAVAAAGLVLVLVAVAVAVAVDSDEDSGAGRVRGAGAGGAGAAVASTAPSVTPARTGPAGSAPHPVNGGDPALPQGWRFYRDHKTGFGVAVPEGWTMSRSGTMVYFRDPVGGRVLGIDQTTRPKPDPVEDWKRQEARRVAAGDWNDYRRVRIVAVKYFVKAADWEFTYRGRSGRMHVINRGFITSAHQAYAIYWSTPQSQWSANLDDFARITGSFRPRR